MSLDDKILRALGKSPMTVAELSRRLGLPAWERPVVRERLEALSEIRATTLSSGTDRWSMVVATEPKFVKRIKRDAHTLENLEVSSAPARLRFAEKIAPRIIQRIRPTSFAPCSRPPLHALANHVLPGFWCVLERIAEDEDGTKLYSEALY